MAKIKWVDKSKEVKHSDTYDARIKQLEERILGLEKRIKKMEKVNPQVLHRV